jgi:hypothetical protein
LGASPSVPTVSVKARLARPRGGEEDEHNDRGHDRGGDDPDGSWRHFCVHSNQTGGPTLDCDWKKA